MVPGSAPITAAAGSGSAPLLLPAGVMLRAAAVLQPAHEGAVAADHLHAVDAEIEDIAAVTSRSSRRGPLVTTSGQVISGAGSPGQQVWIGSSPRSISSPRQHHLLARRRADRLRPHRHHGLQQRQHVERLAPAAGRLGLAQEGQRLADLAQLMRLAVHAPGDPLDGAEQVDQHRHVVALCRPRADVLEQHRRPAVGQQPRLDLGHLQNRATPARARAPAARPAPAGR